MGRVIDLELDLPLTQENVAARQNKPALYLAEMGMAAGLTLTPGGTATLEKPNSQSPREAFSTQDNFTMSLPDFEKQLEEAGIARGLIDAGSAERTAQIIKAYPDKFIGAASFSPFDEMKAVRDLEKAVRECGIKFYTTNHFLYGLRANDKRFYPLYSKAVELGLPVMTCSAKAYRYDYLVNVNEPLDVDEVAISFPEMKLVAGLNGCRTIQEAIALAKRHENLFFSTTGLMPDYLRTPGQGWDILMNFTHCVLQNRLVFASGWLTNGICINDFIKDALNLPLKDAIVDKWMYSNAERLLG